MGSRIKTVRSATRATLRPLSRALQRLGHSLVGRGENVEFCNYG